MDQEETDSHKSLCLLAERWLSRQGFGVVVRDGFRALTETGETPDAIGWRYGVSALIECKVSRSDFLADKSKPFRMMPQTGMGDWRFYLSPPGVIAAIDLPPGWGLLYAQGKRVVAVQGVPGNSGWHTKAPFTGSKMCEVQMMYSALRRMSLRGHLAEIYEPRPV